MKPVIVPFFIAHQGCPHTCIFCNQVKISGAAAILPTPAEILDRIALYRRTSGERGVEAAFFGGSFTCLPLSLQERLLTPLQPLLEKGALAAVRVSTRPDAVDRETAGFLSSMGVRTVELGVQSLDDTVLALAGRGHTARDAENACRILAEAGFRVGLQLMTGLPGDTPAKARATLQRAIGLGPDFFRIYPTLVIVGTELERLYRSGAYVPMTMTAALSLCKVMLHEALKAAIPVIRIGLQVTDDLQPGGAVIAGPCHPAFRQMVEAELFFDLMSKLAREFPPGQKVILTSAPSRVSDVAGQRRANIVRLWQTQGVDIAAIKVDPDISSMELRMENDTLTRIGNMLLDLNYAGEDASHAR